MNQSTPLLRVAGTGDIALLIEHHLRIFNPGNGQDISAEYTKKLLADIPSGTCKAWIIEVNGVAVASGAISFMKLVPVPWDINPQVAYVHSIYTEEAFRRQGLAKRIVEAMMAFCDSLGVHRMWLLASDMGRPLYQKLGFAATTNMMQRLG